MISDVRMSGRRTAHKAVEKQECMPLYAHTLSQSNHHFRQQAPVFRLCVSPITACKLRNPGSGRTTHKRNISACTSSPTLTRRAGEASGHPCPNAGMPAAAHPRWHL
eukprot:scaffold125794_cov16-Tisochrysis_lutea.AAC.1